MKMRDRETSLIFIFGGSGDLNLRKLTPALYNLFIDKYFEFDKLPGLIHSLCEKPVLN